MPAVSISMRKLKEILRLKYGLGLSHRLIARSLVISPSVVSRYRSSRGLDKALIRSLGQGNWLKLKQNLLLAGATGSGKTYLACALGHNACRQGYKVYYYRLKALMDLCYQGHADGRYSKLLTKLNHSDLLLLDDWGLEPLSSEQRSDLLEIVDLMYRNHTVNSSSNCLLVR